MTVGLSNVNFAQKVLNHMLRAQASTAPAANYVRPHIGDPGASGTSNVPATEHTPARASATFNAAALNGSVVECTLSNTPTWTSWSGTSPSTISHISIWDASSAGTFLYSVDITTDKQVSTGDTLTLTSLTVSLTPIAA